MSSSCDGKNHNLIEIFRRWNFEDAADVVRWCQDCGAVVVDTDLNIRWKSPRPFTKTMPGNVMKMKFPNYLRKKVAPLMATPPCPDFGEKGHKTKKDGGLFWECECGFCWWKHDWELPEELRGNR